ncbi:MAG: two-component regulator propeller domain-containing protein [Lysobacterales bacterium]
MRATRNLAAVVCSVVAWLTAAPAAALDPERAITQYASEVLGTPEGLPQNSVQAIAQTPDGYLWFGTQEGVVRFDGVRFTVFDKHNTPALRHNSVQCLTVTRNGDLWIGTFVGGATRLRNGVFTALTTREGLSSDQVRSIVEAPDGGLWIGTNAGLDHYRDGRIESFTPAKGLRNDRILAVDFDREGNLWIGTDGAGVARYRDGRFEWFDTRDGLAGDQVRAIWQSRNGDLWFGSYGGGASRLRAGQWTRYTEADGLASDQVTDIREDRDGNVWLATSGGVSRWSQDTMSSLSSANGLANDLNVALFEDREGSLWIGSNGGGVTRLRDAKVINFTTREGLSSGNARVVLEAHDGAMWIGTDQGLNVVRAGRVRRIEQPGLDARIFSLAQDDAGAIWVGTHGAGLVRLEGEHVAQHLGVAQGLSNNVVRAILPARDGALWVGTDLGLNRIEGDTIKVWRRGDGLSADPVTALLEARDGTLWIATNGGGLNRFREGRFTAFTAREGMGSDVVFALHEAADGAIWAGTDGGGLCRVQGDAVGCVTSAQGLHDDLVVQILDDGAGRLWMASNRGVFNASLKELEGVIAGRGRAVRSTRFGASDGMGSPECHGGSQPSGARGRDGRLWFPTLAGVAVFDPAKSRGNPLPPPVRIEAFVVDGKNTPLSRTNALAPGHKQLEIHYTALSFVNPDAVAFKYRLAGFNPDWIDADTRRVAYFTNLPPGDYAFQVIASNSDGVWNRDGATLHFTRKARPIETWWFKVLAVLAALGVFAIVFQVLSRRHHARRVELVRLVDERTQALAHSNAELTRLSKTDALTGAWNRRGATEALEAEWQRGIDEATPIAALMIDLDSFKAYNDHYGHGAGDECLKSVVEVLAHAVRGPRHVVARMGGEEFLVLLPDTELAAACAVAEDLRARVQSAALRHERAVCGNVVTVSIGVASTRPHAAQSSAALIAAADHALYRAKNAGRNAVVAHEETEE